VRVPLSFFLHDRHPTLAASVSARAVVCFVFHNVHSLYFFATVNAGHQNIRAHCFMLVNFFPNALSFALLKRRALYWCESADLIVLLDLGVGEYLLATQVEVIAHELHVLELLFHFLFY